MSLSSTASLISRGHKEHDHNTMTETGPKKRRRRHQVKEVQPALSFNDVSLTDFDEENAMEDNKDTKEHAEDWDDNAREGKGNLIWRRGGWGRLKKCFMGRGKARAKCTIRVGGSNTL